MRKIEIHTRSINDDIDEAELLKWLSYLAKDQQERLMRFRFREDFLRSLFGEAILRIAAGKKIGVAPEKIKIARPEGKKPFLPDYPEVHFNISHSGVWAVCAIGDVELGIDIEEIKDKELKPPLIKRVLTENEQRYLEMLPDTQRAAAFYRFWTMKEAYSKCIGRGLGIDPNKVDIEMDRKTVYLPDENRVWNGMIQSIDFKDGYAMSVCAVHASEIGYCSRQAANSN